MKIVQIIPELSLAGAQTMCENLTYELIKMGHNVCVISLFTIESTIAKRLKNNGVNVYYLNKKRGLDFSVIIRMRKLLKSLRPDVIHTHLYVLQYVMPASWGLKVKRRVHTIHNIAKEENLPIARKINFVFYHLFKVIPVALSRLIQNSVLEEYKLKICQVPIVFNGVPLDLCIKKNNYTRAGDIVRILHIGRYFEQKNHLDMIRAMKLVHDVFPNAVLELYGDGPLMNNAKELIDELDAHAYIKQCGTVCSPFQILNDSDIFILPSKYEGMPMTLIEAMGTGLPIVASDVGGIPDMIDNYHNGILCAPKIDDIADKIIGLLNNEALCEKLGRSALTDSQKFSAELMAERYVSIYSNGSVL